MKGNFFILLESIQFHSLIFAYPTFKKLTLLGRMYHVTKACWGRPYLHSIACISTLYLHLYWLASPSVKRAVQVRAWHNPFVSEMWNSTSMSSTCPFQCDWLFYQKPYHVLSCLCGHACKRSLAICRKSRASYPVSRLLSAHILPACAKQGRSYDSNKQTKTYQKFKIYSDK